MNLSEQEVLDILTCIPNSVELSVDKVSENLELLKTYLNVEDSELKSIIIEYPILITNLTADIHKLEFYFNLYLDINKETFNQMGRKFPLLLTATVRSLYNKLI